MSAMEPTNASFNVSSPPDLPSHPPCKPRNFNATVTTIPTVLRGCRQKYQKPCEPPNDVCVQRKEWCEFFPPGFITPQTRFGTTYHCKLPCIQSKWPTFIPNMLEIPAHIASQLPVFMQVHGFHNRLKNTFCII